MLQQGPDLNRVTRSCVGAVFTSRPWQTSIGPSAHLLTLELAATASTLGFVRLGQAFKARQESK